MVIRCSLRQLDWFNEETSKVARQTFSYSEKTRKTHSRKKKEKTHWALILSGNVECIVIWGLCGYFDAPLSEPRLFVGFWQPPPPFKSNYLRKRYEKIDHPAKKTQPLRDFFNESTPGFGPPPEVATWRKSLTKSMAAKHSTATRPQPPTGVTQIGENENEHVFCTQKMGKKTPFFK